MAVVGRSVGRSEEIVRMIKDSGGEAMFIRADVSRATDVKKMIKDVVTKYGKSIILFNNAAFTGIQGFADI